MADPRHLSDSDLERALVHLGGRLDYPPTPHLVPALRRRLEARSGARAFGAWSKPLRLGLAAVAVLLAVMAILAAIPATRSAIAGRLGLPGVGITYLPAVPTATPSPTPLPSPLPTPTPVPPGDRLHLGERLSLDQARARVAFPIETPALPDLAAPDAVYVRTPPTSGEVSLVYLARPDLPEAGTTGVGLLLTEFQGSVGGGLLGKGLGPGTRLEVVTVRGAEGYWIEGNPHLFFYEDQNGQVEQETMRLAGNTLLWQQGNVVLRIESALDKAAALRIAESVR